MVETQTSDLLAWAATVTIQIGPLPLTFAVLERQAQGTFYTRRFWNGGRSHDVLLSRDAIMAYVRHNLTNYDDLRNQIKGRPDNQAAYEMLKERCNAAIMAVLHERYGEGAI